MTWVRQATRLHSIPKGPERKPEGPSKARHNRPPYDAVLGQMVMIKDGGVERRVTAAEAFLLHIAKRGLEGDGVAARSAMVVIEEARSARITHGKVFGAVVKRWWSPAA